MTIFSKINIIEQRKVVSESSLPKHYSKEIKDKKMQELAAIRQPWILDQKIIEKYNNDLPMLNLNQIRNQPDFQKLKQAYERINFKFFGMATLPADIFRNIKKEYNPTIDCFASPFDNRLSRYCSMFEIDKKFGSLGNFFDMDISEFEDQVLYMYPPGIELILNKTIERMETILSNVKCTCLLIIPEWNDLIIKMKYNNYFNTSKNLGRYIYCSNILYRSPANNILMVLSSQSKA